MIIFNLQTSLFNVMNAPCAPASAFNEKDLLTLKTKAYEMEMVSY